MVDAGRASERSLRHYEQQGLLRASRTPGGHRHYPASAVERVARIRQLLKAGFDTAKIAKVLSCAPAIGEGRPRPRGRPSPPELADDCARIDHRLVQLRRSRSLLDNVIRTARATRRHESIRTAEPGSSPDGSPDAVRRHCR
ncbi:MerR family transcriptional regulator [Streptomyces sp. NPDC059893]|uniref:MerR family transcriptional regulator n=1 Tax=Streptomyces sp. NPDC059893 TaxID=3346990 RepID=UPI00365E239C